MVIEFGLVTGKLVCFRTLSKYRQSKDLIPRFVGTGSLNKEPVIVLAGPMITARQYMMGGGLKGSHRRAFYINNDVKNFIRAVSKAVEFLHLKRLVHVELSLDSVYVQVK